MKKIILSIDGMTCSACSNGLEKYLNKQNGINSVNVNLVMANAFIEYDEKILTKEKIEELIKKAGFKSLGEFKEIKIEQQNTKNKIIFIIYTILAIILMYISMGNMWNMPMIKFIDINQNPINYSIVLFVFSIVFIIYGFDILKNGYKNLIHKTPNMDTLVGLGVLSSFLYSIYNMFLIFKGNYAVIHNLYFETSSMVIYFVKLGRYLDGITKDKTKEAIQKLVKITPEKAVIKINGEEKVVTIDEVKKGNIVISKPGEKISVDGKIIFGNAHFDESFITGESKPINKTVGQKVIAGSINYDGYIEYEAEKIGKESTISEIIKLVVEASNAKPPIARIADIVSSYFVPTVIGIAIITFIFYLILGYDFSTSLTTFITILVVACPCSLGLATPLAIVVSEGLCASKGILIKKGEVLDEFSCFVNPEKPIPQRVVEVTNITDDMVKDAETIDKVFPKMLDFIGDSVLVAHNADFDIGFLKYNASELGYTLDNTYLDTLRLAKELFPDYKKYKLGIIAENLGIKVEVAR